MGGTRNCDWWFTDEAILLDTAGRYTTQDSDARADAAGWARSCSCCASIRSRQPINGVIVAMSASDLLDRGREGARAPRRRHPRAARRARPQRCASTCRCTSCVTKCDLVAGFTRVLRRARPGRRARRCGARRSPSKSTESGRAPEQFEQGVRRGCSSGCSSACSCRMERERDPRRRVGMLAFPQQMAALSPLLERPAEARLQRPPTSTASILLRGVYFTSGTQEGTPMDRVLGADRAHVRCAAAVRRAAGGARQGVTSSSACCGT